jgi:hypothetical protein
VEKEWRGDISEEPKEKLRGFEISKKKKTHPWTGSLEREPMTEVRKN